MTVEIPPFLRIGERIVIEDKADHFFKGEWEVVGYEYGNPWGSKASVLYLKLKNPDLNSFINIPFNGKTMRPAPPKPPPAKPAALTRDVPVMKRIMPKKNPKP